MFSLQPDRLIIRYVLSIISANLLSLIISYLLSSSSKSSYRFFSKTVCVCVCVSVFVCVEEKYFFSSDRKRKIWLWLQSQYKLFIYSSTVQPSLYQWSLNFSLLRITDRTYYNAVSKVPPPRNSDSV